MNPLTRFPLRKIAVAELAKRLGDLDPGVRQELATSMVRQWITNDGHAGFVTLTRQFWFRAVPAGDRLEVGFGEAEGNWGRILADDWHVDRGEIPGLLHRLNVCQAAACRTADGLTIRLRIEPKEQRVFCEEAEPEETEP
jgi:hypothetical protein